ncbi:MAG: ribonuclease HI family protein [Thermodesulfobacteriota bacterium]
MLPDGSRDVLLRLAAGLPEDELVRLFPEMKAGTVRRLLVEWAGGPEPAASEPAEPLPESTATAGAELVLSTDGASRGNPGEAGAGMVIEDSAGRELFARGEYLGRCTNNVAEYTALIRGLQEAGRFAPGSLEVRMDSELIVRQLNGQYRVKSPDLLPLFSRARQLLAAFPRVRIVHVRRGDNSRADALANRGIDDRRRT